MFYLIVFSVLLNHSLVKEREDQRLYLETMEWLYQTKPDPWSQD